MFGQIPDPDNTFQTQVSVTKSIITTDQVKVNSAYEPSGPDQAGAYPGLCLDRHKATIDIRNYLIKIANNLLSTPLTNLFNESTESGIVPDVFKISKVTPVLKTCAMTDPGNYRPLLCFPHLLKFLKD